MNKTFSIPIDSDLQARLLQAAEMQNKTPTEIAEDAITAYLDAQQAFRLKVIHAIEEADKGIFVSQEAMHRWMNSWGTDHELDNPEPDIFLK